MVIIVVLAVVVTGIVFIVLHVAVSVISILLLKNRALQVPPVVPYKALGRFPKALYGTTEGTPSARHFRPVRG